MPPVVTSGAAPDPVPGLTLYRVAGCGASIDL
jgi:hypothetical protein